MANTGLSSAFAQAIFASSPTALFLRFLTAICVSAVAAINFSHAATGATSGLLFGAISACAGFASAFALHYLVTTRGLANRLTCAVVFVVSLIMCLLASISAQSNGKGDRTAQRQAEIDAHTFLISRRKMLSEELAALGSPRAPSVVIADIAAAPVDPAILKRSQQCADISRDDTKKACEPILRLRQEQGRAARKVEIDEAISSIAEQIRAFKVGDADAQSETFAWTLGLFGYKADRGSIARSLVLLQSVLIEIFAATLAGLAAVADEAARRKKVEPVEVVTTKPEPVKHSPPAHQSAVPTIAPVITSLPRAGTADARLLEAIRTAGTLKGTHRELSIKLGMPSSTLSSSARRLADRGLIRVGAGVLIVA